MSLFLVVLQSPGHKHRSETGKLARTGLGIRVAHRLLTLLLRSSQRPEGTEFSHPWTPPKSSLTQLLSPPLPHSLSHQSDLKAQDAQVLHTSEEPAGPPTSTSFSSSFQSLSNHLPETVARRPVANTGVMFPESAVSPSLSFPASGSMRFLAKIVVLFQFPPLRALESSWIVLIINSVRHRLASDRRTASH